MNFALILAPNHLPKERARMYAEPMITTDIFEKTFSSSSAPLSTKNRMYSGAVQRSVLSMISAEKSHTLQNTVPSIMQTSRLEKPIFTPPTSNSIIESATVRMTNVMDRDRRLLLDLKYFSAAEKMLPITKPRTMDMTISRIGSTRMLVRS